MSLYLEQILQLVALQEVDDAIMKAERELLSAPAELESLTKKFESLESQKDKQAEKMATLKEQESRVNTELEEASSRRRKSRSKLMQVSNSREYQAVAREMDGMEKIQKNREEEHTAITDEITLHTSVMAETDAKYDAIKSDLESMQASLNNRMEIARREHDGLVAKRLGMSKTISRPILERYEFIRRRLAHPAIVSVTKGICNGCHIAIPPQTYIDLQSGQKILNCPNCQRLMYWDETLKPTSEA